MSLPYLWLNLCIGKQDSSISPVAHNTAHLELLPATSLVEAICHCRGQGLCSRSVLHGPAPVWTFTCLAGGWRRFSWKVYSKLTEPGDLIMFFFMSRDFPTCDTRHQAPRCAALPVVILKALYTTIRCISVELHCENVKVHRVTFIEFCWFVQ